MRRTKDTTDLLASCEDAVAILEETLVGFGLLIAAQRADRHISERAMARLQRQCISAAVGASQLRQTLARYQARRSE